MITRAEITEGAAGLPLPEKYIEAGARAKALHAATGMSMMAIGIQLFMNLYGLATFLETPNAGRKGRWPWICMGFLLLILSALAEGFQTSMNIRRGAYAVVIFGDTVLLYRCYVIWADRLWIVVVPALIHLSTIGVVTRRIIDLARTQSCAPLFHSTFILLSSTFNVLATVLISSHIRRSYKRLSKALPEFNLTFHKRAIEILIESAVPLTMCGLARSGMELVTVRVSKTPGVLAEDWWQNFLATGIIVDALYYIFAALSPQWILFRVTLGRSYREQPFDTLTSRPNESPMWFSKDSDLSQYEDTDSIREKTLGDTDSQGKPSLDLEHGYLSQKPHTIRADLNRRTEFSKRDRILGVIAAPAKAALSARLRVRAELELVNRASTLTKQENT
ncbi:hypothetical protein CC1G_07638 [Coprinopsis cinerea okayama7|uniref:Uncharacterized protein n=1 Tax=Coprinopsis cinerea (strain Okayama-7 / 130 / ATCC MYA-4618 / FGSC 9003) TaxID=240176 RepID=A8NC34_COPC7|nr:hypothetical protein CC1G_07638 [Coprinopsis cinerea okayama7\|eukprot:XP_001832378.2 hypothetical protein CC1G_07638 [Coprinopsis cinerea okayama7\